MQAFITACQRDIIWYAHTRLVLCLMPPVSTSAQVMLERELRRLRSPRTPVFMGLPPVFETATQVDALLARLEETRRELRTARNALLPVARIPVEVLSTIFRYLLDHNFDQDPDRGMFSVPKTKDVRAASQVCRHWRAVALNCALLWRWPEVLAVRPEYTKLMLIRSKKTTIFFRTKLYNSNKHVVDACRLVLGQVDRLGEIHVSGSNSAISLILNFVPGAAPRLRSLIVQNSGWKAAADILMLSQSFLQGGAPALERLELQKCMIPWDAPLLTSCPNLQSMMLDGLETNRAMLSQFLGTLATMPHLTVLHMENVVPVNQALPDGLQRIPLQDLEKLYLAGSTSDIAALLTHLTFPPSTALSLRCTCSDKPNELSLLTDVLGARLTASRIPFPLRALHISLDAVQITLHARAAEALVLEEVDMNWAFDGAAPFVHALQEAQCLRCAQGRPVDELRIKRCMNIGAREVRTLCHLFADVQWDAFEAYVTDADSEPGADEAELDENVWADYWEYEGVAIGWHS